jgi:hypothetical protein
MSRGRRSGFAEGAATIGRSRGLIIGPNNWAEIGSGTERCYGAGGEEMPTSSLHPTDGATDRSNPVPSTSESQRTVGEDRRSLRPLYLVRAQCRFTVLTSVSRESRCSDDAKSGGKLAPSRATIHISRFGMSAVSTSKIRPNGKFVCLWSFSVD